MILKNIPICVLAVTVASLTFSSAASAATLNYNLVTQANDPAAGADRDELFQASPNPVTGAVSVVGNESASVRASAGSSQGSAGFEINQQTGAIKFGALATPVATHPTLFARVESYLTLRLLEDLVISGTGNVTFRMRVEGDLTNSTTETSIVPPVVGGAIRLLTNDSRGLRTFKSDDFRVAGALNATTSVDETLEFSLSLTSANNPYLFVMDLEASALLSARPNGSGSSSADFFSTAFLSIVADDTITVTASDPLFLSGGSTGPVSPVPLPAAAWMLLAAVAGLGAIRRRKAADKPL